MTLAGAVHQESTAESLPSVEGHLISYPTDQCFSGEKNQKRAETQWAVCAHISMHTTLRYRSIVQTIIYLGPHRGTSRRPVRSPNTQRPTNTIRTRPRVTSPATIAWALHFAHANALTRSRSLIHRRSVKVDPTKSNTRFSWMCVPVNMKCQSSAGRLASSGWPCASSGWPCGRQPWTCMCTCVNAQMLMGGQLFTRGVEVEGWVENLGACALTRLNSVLPRFTRVPHTAAHVRDFTPLYVLRASALGQDQVELNNASRFQDKTPRCGLKR